MAVAKPSIPKQQNQPKGRPNNAPKISPEKVTANRAEIQNQIEHLARMTPAQREKALKNLPPNRRARLEAGLDRWNNLTPAQKEQQEKFYRLPLARQQRIRELSQQIQSLPDDRKVAVRREIARLRKMEPDQREKRLESRVIKEDFSPEEQQILRESPNVLPPNFG